MTLNVEEGFHKGTLISCVLISLFGIMFAMMLAPNTPYLIRIYLPNVKNRLLRVNVSFQMRTLELIQESLLPLSL